MKQNRNCIFGCSTNSGKMSQGQRNCDKSINTDNNNDKCTLRYVYLLFINAASMNCPVHNLDYL